ncbi:Methyl methanesulfonate-sensitivity protein 22 [Metarhizium rileyi]|uniref:Methyl methanesulfonate-sensitivity protein 22 n=1 Tax=Metarhizium rileyi (strain RCEF 4871) TaxID=1649241 RepID=A0A167ESF6_METRR|nr:Methyl methanesulfonate-sensitivity protein 22 [Metarhizium rileyi RCEF 4871]
MVNWKELGEIPDSEDDEEDLDSRKFDTQPTVTSTDAVPGCDAEPDIWNFPDSPMKNDNHTVTNPQTPIVSNPVDEHALETVVSSPLSSARSEDGLSPVDDFFFGDETQEQIGISGKGDTSLSGSSQMQSRHPPPELMGLPLLSNPPFDGHGFSRKAEGQSHRDEISEAQRIATRYERSLRPRKPIQEHPYLLENAQYSSFLKLHGVKPLRMAIENERKKRDSPPGSSQNDEFQQESQAESQEVSQEVRELDPLHNSSVDGSGSSGNLDSLTLASTPLRQSPTSGCVGFSSPVSSNGETDNTSVPDQDLPAIEELLANSSKLASVKANKGDVRPFVSSTRKRARKIIIDSDPVEEASARVVSSAKSPSMPRSPSLRIPRLLHFSSDKQPNRLACAKPPTSPAASLFDSIMGSVNSAAYLTSSDDERTDDIATENNQPALVDSDNSSSSETEAVTTLSRRIRGVLPASWLRLDQQAGRENAKKSLSRRVRPSRSLEIEHKRGVAQSRHATNSRASPPVFYDASDEGEVPTLLHVEDIQVDDQVQLNIDRAACEIPDTSPRLESDGDLSIVEDNEIDFMLSRPSRKRQLKLTDKLDQGARKRLKGKHRAMEKPRRKLKKAGIQTHLLQSATRGNSDFSVSENLQEQDLRRRTKHHLAPKTADKLARASPPNLGILDVIQPDAPRFLKIAARTARTRQHQGRSSPRKKIIQLATRQDQIDAASVLISWQSGIIHQRGSVTQAAKSFQKKLDSTLLAEAFKSVHFHNTIRATPKHDLRRKLVKHVSNGGTVRYRPNQTPSQRQHLKTAREAVVVKKKSLNSTRPAQLEIDEDVRITRLDFNSRKRFVDRLYQNRCSEARKSSRESAFVPGSVTSLNTSMPGSGRQQADEVAKSRGPSRIRRKALPQRIDIDAPQYSHAKDPVPDKYSIEPASAVAEPAKAKLLGLGPYGTQYTHHFEIFPLHPDVFFHESTLIGSGELQSCAAITFSISGFEEQPHMSLRLNNHVFRWSAWDDQASSELGVVLDYIAECIESHLTRKPGPWPNEPSPFLATKFILSYTKDSVRCVGEGQRLSFALRVIECLGSLNDRVGFAVRTSALPSMDSVGQVLQIYDVLLLIAFLLLKLCNQDSSLLAEKLPAEILVQSLGATVISILANFGMGNLHKFYMELHNKHYREAGIRNDSPVIHSWVMVIKVLDLAHIPRASFWDLAQCLIAPKQDILSANAQDHERIWENMFSLLPLMEFSTAGVLVAGQRHNVSSDGWAIPQKLLRQVFQLYEQNTRQAASFNNYCRALVGRCHYLVQEWGWKKCVGIVGLIFDFFGARKLAHLRNEEVFESPRFLESLCGRPTLAIEPEDRCFHVFLKLVAVALRKLRDAGSMKDVGNLVTRIVPNHDRQHRKDENVHARDLAALRNHHDLLCTLFWAAPVECRPSPVLIQTLVDPANSHKEACLINLRAWTQLARFVINSGEPGISWKPFHIWRSSFFEQVLKQINSVASEVAVQLTSLGNEASHSITDEMISTTVAVNKAALIDVLHASLTASLSVAQQAQELQTATFAWNTTQLRTIFTQFPVTPSDPAWGLLQVSLATLEEMLSKIDDIKVDGESQESESQMLNMAVADDALLLLDQNLSQAFFGMARRVLASLLDDKDSYIAKRDHVRCTERIVILAARLSVRFINGGLMRLSGSFKGKYKLFSESPFKLDLHQQTYVVLFMATLLRHGVDDFGDAGFSPCEVWVSSLIKPRTYLKYEIELGKELRRRGEIFVPVAVTGITTPPNYTTNRNLLEYAISSMRTAVRDAGPTLRAGLMIEYSSALKLMMNQMKDDLKNETQTWKEHDSYVVFVQAVVSLVKTHAFDICPVDNYFYQISKEYSPSAEDPQLKVANLKSYGLRLQDGDARIAQSLFHLLFNNAKFSIVNNKLTEEVRMLGKGMSNAGVKTFIMSKMLPAILYACFKENDAFPLLDIYAEAFARCFGGKTVSLELEADDAPAVCTLLRVMLDGMNELCKDGWPLTGGQMHLAIQVVGLCNLLWPSIHALSMSCLHSQPWTTLWGLLCDWCVVVSKYHGGLPSSNREDLSSWSVQSEGIPMESGEVRSEVQGLDPDVVSLAENIVQDVRKNWRITQEQITIQIPGQNKGTAAAPLVALAGWKREDLVDEMNDGIQEWSWWWRKANGLSYLKSSSISVF